MSKKILVADDSQTIQRAVAIALADEDVALVGVSDPGQVLAKAQEVMPALILLDNRMNTSGQDDGYEICAQLKADATVGHLPVVFLAGQSFSNEQGDAAGAVLAIEKPFDTKEFSEKLTDLLEVSDALAGKSSSPSLEAPAASPPATIAQTPVPRETTGMPSFQPVDPSSVLPEGEGSPAVAEAPSGGGMTPPPMPPSLPTGQEERLNNVASFGSDASLTPPPLPGGGAPAAATPPPMPRAESSGGVTPPSIPNAGLEEAPQTVEYSTPLVPGGGEEAPRRSPLLIPSPTDEAQEFPVKEFLQPSSRSSTPTPESELEMASPEYIQQGAPAPAGAQPGFAIPTGQDFLARALHGTRTWPTPAAEPSSPQESAQMDYIRQLSVEVVERIAWEVVPELAEHIIKEALAKQNNPS